MTTIGKLPPPKVERDGTVIRVEWFNGDRILAGCAYEESALGVALLELIERREADVVGVATSELEPVQYSPLLALVGYVNDARADVAGAAGQCATNDAAEALTTALAHLNAVVRLCEIAAVKDGS